MFYWVTGTTANLIKAALHMSLFKWQYNPFRPLNHKQFFKELSAVGKTQSHTLHTSPMAYATRHSVGLTRYLKCDLERPQSVRSELISEISKKKLFKRYSLAN